MYKFLLKFLYVIPVLSFAGQSISVSGGQYAINSSIPGIASNATCRLEVSIHNWGTPSGSYPFGAPACDLSVSWNSSSPPVLNMFSSHEIGGGSFSINLSGVNLATIRYQRVASTASTGTDYAQAWDENGNLFYNQQASYTGISSVTTLNSINVGGTTSNIDFAYIRMFPTAVSISFTPPTTAEVQTGMVFQWKFDNGNNVGSLSDSTGNGYTATMSSGSPSYVNTPYQNLIVSSPRTCNAPTWSSWISFRKGDINNCISAAASYSQIDASAVVTPTWTNVSGPTVAGITSPSSLVSYLTNIISTGLYTFNLAVVDVNNNTANTNFGVGAVGIDTKGIIIPDNPNVTKIFGPMIAFGYNPWGYEDERSLEAANAQISGATYYNQQASYWSVPATGTVSYPFGSIGFEASGFPGATLNSSITASSTSIVINNAQNLPSLANLPTWLMIGTGGDSGNFEVVRIISTTATSGVATLTVGYDGRGLAGSSSAYGYQQVVRAQSWSSGTTVGEMRINGSGTSFISDPSRPICPAGSPGPPGPVVYSTGTVTLTASSTTVAGSGTNWTSGVVAGDYILVSATHGSIPFNYWAQIQTVTDSSHLVVDHPAPVGVDNSTFTYKITSPIYLSLGFMFTAAGETIARQEQAVQSTLGCESQTAAFAAPTHDIPLFNDTIQTGVNISYTPNLSAIGFLYGPNLYGSGGMNPRSFYLRSGYTPALTAANLIDEYWIRDPQVCVGLCGGNPLELGGGVIGAIADLMTNSSTTLAWPDIYQFAENGGAVSTQTCNSDDTRDTGYELSALSLAGIFDLNTTRNPIWISDLLNDLTWDQTCRRNVSDGYSVSNGFPTSAANSWANSLNFYQNVPISLTNGSATATGSGLVSSVCAGTAQGTITVTNGSSLATIVSGTLTYIAAGNGRLNITDTISSPIYVGGFEFSANGSGVGSTVQLAGVWPGASGTFNWLEEDNSLLGYGSTIGNLNSDWPSVTVAQGLFNNKQLQKNWSCIYNSPTQLTLNRPWDGTNGTYYIYDYAAVGFFQEPFMLGIKTAAMNWASQVVNTTVSSGYSALSSQAGTWMYNYGYDTNTLGTYYGRVFNLCEPSVTAAGMFVTIHNACGASGLSNPSGEANERVNSVEAGSGYLSYYNNNVPSARTFMDQMYGAVYGNCSMTAPGYYCDPLFVNTANELSNGSLTPPNRWGGFFFGVGGLLSNSWPALRQLGTYVLVGENPKVNSVVAEENNLK